MTPAAIGSRRRPNWFRGVALDLRSRLYLLTTSAGTFGDSPETRNEVQDAPRLRQTGNTSRGSTPVPPEALRDTADQGNRRVRFSVWAGRVTGLPCFLQGRL